MKRRNSAIELETDTGTAPFNNTATQGNKQRFDTYPFERGCGGFCKDGLQGFDMLGAH